MKTPAPASPADLAPRLLRWFDQHRRDLPWRRTTDPYHVWVSEVMLQQTQVTTVIPYYERFLKAFPDVQALAAAPVDEVMGLWAGLGYYSRARNLHAAARVICTEHGGAFPGDYESARALPGVGEYTAGAVLSIAYGVRLPALDGNAFRVLARVWGVRGEVQRGPARRRLSALGREAVPTDRPGDYNQALMEQGSQVCAPGQPHCGECCLADICAALAQGLQDQIPESRRAAPTDVTMSAALVLRRGKVLVAKRPATGVWGGLWELPNVQGGERQLLASLRDAFGLASYEAVEFTRLTHGIMNRRVTLTAYLVPHNTGRPRASGHEAVAWVDPAAADSHAMPAPHRKLLARLAEHLRPGRLAR